MICISLDLDGTLLNSKHEVSHKNKQVIRELKESGAEVLLNTGRSYDDIPATARELGLPTICLNGSMIFNEAGEKLFETTLSKETCRDIIQNVNKADVGLLIYTNQGGFPSTLPGLLEKSNEEIDAMFEDYDYESILEKEDLKIYKVIAWTKEDELHNIEDAISQAQKVYGINYCSSFPNNLEITSLEGQKGSAICRYETMKFAAYTDVYAFGDGGNDLSQFDVATVSVAMANAPDHIKQSADFVTMTNDDDGVEYAIRELLNLSQ